MWYVTKQQGKLRKVGVEKSDFAKLGWRNPKLINRSLYARSIFSSIFSTPTSIDLIDFLHPNFYRSHRFSPPQLLSIFSICSIDFLHPNFLEIASLHRHMKLILKLKNVNNLNVICHKTARQTSQSWGGEIRLICHKTARQTSQSWGGEIRLRNPTSEIRLQKSDFHPICKFATIFAPPVNAYILFVLTSYSIC